MLKTLYSFIIILLFCSSLFSQNNITVNLRLNTGGKIDFIFNTNDDFQSGIDIIERTEVQIYFNDTVLGGIDNPASKGWILEVEAESDKLYSFFGSSFLDLNVIELASEYTNISGTHSLSGVVLANSPTIIAQWQVGDPVKDVTESILISYSAKSSGTTDLTTKTRGFYSVNLLLTLREGY